MSTPKFSPSPVAHEKLLQSPARASRRSRCAAGAEVTLLDLAEYDLPIFNEDLESAGTPENATRLSNSFWSTMGYLLPHPSTTARSLSA
ncbi:MAG: hypothetical protein R3C11_13875 [Planctomycetaceae bacterium]